MINLDRKLYFNKAGIYFIKSSIKNKIYVGSSNNLYKRINQHIKQLRSNTHLNKYLQRHFNKYGEKVFSIEIPETIERINGYKKLLIQREQFYIDIYYSKYGCFNLHKNAIYFKDNSKARLKQSLAFKKFWKDNHEDMKAKVVKNLSFIDYKNRKHVCWNKGKTLCYTKESLNKMSKAAKNRSRDSYNIKTVYQYNLKGVFLKKWRSAKDVVEFYKKSLTTSTNINACCLNKRKTCLGFLWSYKKLKDFNEK